jgi:ribosomal protein S27AE
MFQDRKLIIATKHEKEKVIAPLLERALGVSCFVDENFDTDMLGTFTGEVERELDPIATARKKCLTAMELSNCDLGVASEGSFGPHPSMFFVNADDEFLIFIDKKNNLEIIVRELSTATNFNGKEIKNEEELLDFASAINFPTHGLILRKTKSDNDNIIKGITNLNRLKEAFTELLDKFKTVYAETDMRAMYNPSRMKVIEAATQKLITKINSLCPQCSQPGFGITDAKRGLACSLCGLPTQSTLSYIYVCQQCEYTKEEMYPHKKTTEDPMYCDYCNP